MKLLLMVLLLLLVSCGKQEESQQLADSLQTSTQTDELKPEIKPTETITANQETAAVFVGYKFTKGDKLRYKMTSTSSNLQTIEADSSLTIENVLAAMPVQQPVSQNTTFLLESIEHGLNK